MVMRCVTSVKYAVKVNGKLTDSFLPTRGIRQGDPISPYLFLLCAEGLSCLMQQKEAVGELKGIRNGRNGPPISHLLFADDSVFFTRGDDKSIHALNSALQTYCEASGQMVNLQKSSIFFSKNCHKQVKETVKQKLGVLDETLQTTYLGMPTCVGRSPTSNFNFLTGRLWKHLNGWSDRPLSRALSICERMRKAISNFWWGVEDGKKKLHWRSWKWLSSPKYLGGMGFRDFAMFNQAMLAKQGWRLLTEPNSLCARVLKGRYFPNGDFWTAQCPRSSSYTWRSIMHGKKLLDKGILWRVGDGKYINILRDRWIPEVTPGTLLASPSINDNQTVISLLKRNERQWNETAIRKSFPEEVADKILSIPLSFECCEDFPS